MLPSKHGTSCFSTAFVPENSLWVRAVSLHSPCRAPRAESSAQYLGALPAKPLLCLHPAPSAMPEDSIWAKGLPCIWSGRRQASWEHTRACDVVPHFKRPFQQLLKTGLCPVSFALGAFSVNCSAFFSSVLQQNARLTTPNPAEQGLDSPLSLPAPDFAGCWFHPANTQGWQLSNLFLSYLHQLAEILQRWQEGWIFTSAVYFSGIAYAASCMFSSSESLVIWIPLSHSPVSLVPLDQLKKKN